jgi:hypothetical protein
LQKSLHNNRNHSLSLSLTYPDTEQPYNKQTDTKQTTNLWSPSLLPSPIQRVRGRPALGLGGTLLATLMLKGVPRVGFCVVCVMLCYFISYRIMLRYIVLCCVTLCYVMLHNVKLRYVIQCYVTRCYAMLCYVSSCYDMLSNVILCCVMLLFSVNNNDNYYT